MTGDNGGMAVAAAGSGASADGGSGFVLFTREGCTWCDHAKDLLDERQLAYVVVECTTITQVREHLESRGLGDAAGFVATYPQILDGRRYVGGFDQLVEYLDEPLLRPEIGTRRFTPFPIQYPDMWDFYKRAVASFWTADEVSMAQDVTDWRDKLNDDERHFIKHVLAFFAGSDGIVMENLQQNFGVEVQVAEARQFYAYQAFNEAEHSRTYGLMIDALIEDANERERLFWAIETLPAVRRKAAWATRWLSPARRFAERLLAFACVEGILFSGSFCAVFWLKQRGLMPGLGLSNQFISRDEGLHQQFAAVVYSHLRRQLSQGEAEAIVREAVETEKSFICDAVPCRLVGMNADLMSQYIEFVADRLLLSLGHAAVYGATNPFPWMELLSLSGKDNFFERFSSEYQKAGVMAKADDQKFALDEAF